jgi:regulator of protease activity HflC (stomatin/prohibitin superfamily)
VVNTVKSLEEVGEILEAEAEAEAEAGETAAEAEAGETVVEAEETAGWAAGLAAGVDEASGYHKFSLHRSRMKRWRANTLYSYSFSDLLASFICL